MESKKTRQLHSLLLSDNTEFILEAHNGISAQIVEQAGFKGIWASGLAMSAQFGVRDSNEASWTQVVEMLEFMSDATNIPILLDGDTGYGNFNNMRRLVRKLEQRDIAGVCIEDKVFPKTNSFIDGEIQPLAEIDEFSGKIKAGKDSQQDDDFCIIARTEALIAGWGMQEALKRAEAYQEAGADAILIHSKQSRADEILEFAKEWDNRLPLIIVPTKYYSTPTSVFEQAKISLVIWANHIIRSSITAMETVSREIYEQQAVVNIEDKIATVNDIFTLQGADELTEAQDRYLQQKQEAHAIILAASRGNALQELTEDKPKVMLPISGIPLLRRLTNTFKQQAINNITVVAGYKAETITEAGVNICLNNEYESTGELASLACSIESLHEHTIIMYGDLLFRGYILNDLVDMDDDFVIVVDSSLSTSHISGSPDYVYCSQEDSLSIFSQQISLKKISEDENQEDGKPSGRWIGMLKAKDEGITYLKNAIEQLKSDKNFNQMSVPDLLNYMVEQGKNIKVLYIHGHWLDVNVLEDIDRATDFTHGL